MYSTKQKVSDAAAVAKEHVDILKAKAQEKAQKATASTKEEKEIAHEMRKAKEAEAKMKMHEAKAEHAEEKLYGKHHGPLHAHAGHHHQGNLGHHHEPVAAAVVPPTGTVSPKYPLGGQRTGWTGPK